MSSLKINILVLSLVGILNVFQNVGLAGPVQSASQAAAIPGPKDPLDPPWLNDKYPNCGQSCLYSKAAENIMLQADYLSGKIFYVNQSKKMIDQRTNEINQLQAMKASMPPSAQLILDQQINDLQKNKDDEIQNIKGTLGNFCTQGEDGVACGQRYVHTHGIVLLSMQKAIAANKDKVAQLADNRSGSVSKNKRPDFFIPRTNTKEFDQLKVLLPHLPSYAELQKMDRANADAEVRGRLLPLTRADYVDWARDLANRPDRNDSEDKQLFVKSEAVDLTGDPTNPYWIFSRDNKGKVKVDNDAYNKRERFLDKIYKSKGKDSAGKDLPSNMEGYTNRMIADAQSGRVDGILRDRKSNRNLEWSSSPNEAVYNTARGENVDLVNNQLVGLGFAKKSNPTNTQAAVKFYNGSEKVNEVLIKDTLKKNKNQTPSMTFNLAPDLYGGVIDDIMNSWHP